MRNHRIIIPVMIMITLCQPVNTRACELLYTGGNMTDDGANMFMRSEEIGADDSVADMCEYMGIEPDAFFEQMGICELDYVSDLHNFLNEHPEYDHIEYMGELVSHEDLDNIADELFADYLASYNLADLVE